jgi:hypothetical protein
LVHDGQFETGRLRAFVAISCLLLVLVFAGLEAMHAHPDGNLSGQSGHCALCITVHANAPALTFHPLPALRTVAMVALPALDQGQGIGKEISLFIRPPPLS